MRYTYLKHTQCLCFYLSASEFYSHFMACTWLCGSCSRRRVWEGSSWICLGELINPSISHRWLYHVTPKRGALKRGPTCWEASQVITGLQRSVRKHHPDSYTRDRWHWKQSAGSPWRAEEASPAPSSPKRNWMGVFKGQTSWTAAMAAARQAVTPTEP